MSESPSRRSSASSDPYEAELSSAEELESYERLRGVVEAYGATTAVSEVELQSLRSRIMEVVEAEVIRGPSTALLSAQGRPYLMATAALRAQVREAVDRVPHLRARKVLINTDSAGSGVLSIGVTVTMDAAGAVEECVPAARESIAHSLQELVGVSVARVDIAVEDVHDA